MRTISILLLSFSLNFAILAQEKERLSLEHYQDYEWTSSPRLSPDGEQILYSRTWINLVDDKRETDLWIVQSDGTMNRFLLNGSDGRWSPDGSRLAFTRKGEPDGNQIFVKYLGVEGEPTQITKLGESPGGMEWSPDGRYIAFTMHVDTEPALELSGIPKKPKGAKWTEAPRVIDQVDYSQDRVGFLQRGYRQLFIVPSEGGAARQITDGNWNVSSDIDWSNDGQKIYFSSYRMPEAEYARRQSNIYSVDIYTKSIEEITNKEGTESSIRVSPVGDQIAFVGSVWTKNFYHDRKLYVMNTDGSNVRCLSESIDEIPGNPQWSSDASSVYFTIREKGVSNLYVADLSGSTKKVTEGNHMLSVTDLSKQGTAVATWSDYHSPGDIVTVDLATGSINRITDVNGDIFDFIDLGEIEEIWYKSTDGLDIQGWIVKPPGFDPQEKYPLVLRIHGGPHGMYNVGFNYNFQLHAAQDQVVLYTNPRGSTGYGYDFANAIQNSYPGNDYDDLMAGVDEVIRKGYIDENKMYVYGGSGGGVLTSWIVGQTDRFAAASVNYPVTNWFSFVGTTDGAGWYYNFEKYPWEDPSEHLKRSPLMYVGNVKTPTMLMCGENDLRTPISQTEEYYQALKMNKVPTVMIRFNDEFHGTSRKPSNFLRTFGYLNAWFEKYPERKSLKP